MTSMPSSSVFSFESVSSFGIQYSRHVTCVSVTGIDLICDVWHAEDLLKVLEQQAHSAVSQESSDASTSGQGTANGPVKQTEPATKHPQPSSTQQVMLAKSN